MKKQLLFLSVAVAALLAGCSKHEPEAPVVDNTPATEIMAKAVGADNIDTKAPVTGTSLDGQTADVYALTTKLVDATPATMFTEAYGRGEMTFDDAKYVGFDKGTLAGKDGGKSLLPQGPANPVYLYGFYPKGWTIAASVGNAGVEALSMAFDGSNDLMSTYLVAADDVEIAYGTATDKGELNFKHLLTRYNIQVKAESAEAITAWGAVKSVAIKDAATANNVVEFQQTDVVKYSHDMGKPAPAFFKLTGTPAAPTYADTKFEAADFATSQALTDAFVNACYAMLAPVTVDTDKTTAEIILEVVTLDKAGGTDKKTEVPVSLDQAKFAANTNSTRGYSVTLTLNFRAGAIQAIATVEEWKDAGSQNEDIDGTTPGPIRIGDVVDDGVVYWVDATNKKHYKVLSLDQGTLAWDVRGTYVLGPDGQNETDGKANVAAMKAYSANTGTNGTTGTFATDFPAAGFCDRKNTGGVTGWYLPAKDELLVLYTAYKAHTDVLDKAITDNSGTAMVNDRFWSSTEGSSNTSGARSVNFSNGATDNSAKASSYSVRCVRDITPPPAIGDAKDGGIVYEVNGANYKVFSLDEGSSLKWAAQTSYVIGSAGQSDTDGKANTDAIKAYFAANEATVGTDFSVAFPAAEFCDRKNMGGVTGWYLPAKEEVVALSTAYNTNKDVLDKAITDNSGTAFSASGTFWSSTEDSSYTYSAWRVNFSDGGTGNRDKGINIYVRCVRAN